MKRKIPDLIQSLPMNVITRMHIERNYIRIIKFINKLLNRKKDNSSIYYPLVRNNRLYGDELLLKKYSNTNKDLYAIIEHGLYFGNNIAKVGNEFEWDLGCILTLGDYRKNLINKNYPDYYCETIGPLIHYADVDEEYMGNIINMISAEKKTLLFFPVHGNEKFSPIYDARNTIKKIIEIADIRECYNIIICVYYGTANIYESICKELNNKRILITSCGSRFDDKFLCRQKALIQIADVTMSNSLGTHIGYCIYMGKPHVLLPQSFSYEGSEEELEKDFGKNNRSSNWKSDYDKEIDKFQKLFSLYYNTITNEQLEICNYYWGINKVKSKEQIKIIYDKCEKYALKYQRR